MSHEGRVYTFDRVVRFTFNVGLLFGLVWFFRYLSDVLIPFAVALLLAYLINPLVLLVQKKVKNHTASIFISLFTVVFLAVLLILLILPLIVDEITQMGRILSEVVNNSTIAKRATDILPPDVWQALQEYAAREDIQGFFKTENFWKIVETIARKVLPGLWGLIAGAASLVIGLAGLFVIALYLIFLLKDYQIVSQGWKDLLPVAYRDIITGFVSEFDVAMNRYFRAQAAVASIVGVMFAVGFWLIGLPMGILLGLFIGLLNMVPYLQIIGLIPAFFLAIIHVLETGSSLWVVLGQTGLVFVIVQLIQDSVVSPRIMGKVTGLNPAMILLSLSIWGKLLGIFGLIIALPMTCLILAYYRSFLAKQEADVSLLTDEKE
ncbi:MAG: AI-2E family transporter [Thermodesulfobacteriota bacterium]|nr:AI-2E family transporter [Thermodesulfobacteriota bacterium]